MQNIHLAMLRIGPSPPPRREGFPHQNRSVRFARRFSAGTGSQPFLGLWPSSFLCCARAKISEKESLIPIPALKRRAKSVINLDAEARLRRGVSGAAGGMAASNKSAIAFRHSAAGKPCYAPRPPLSAEFAAPPAPECRAWLYPASIWRWSPTSRKSAYHRSHRAIG